MNYRSKSFFLILAVIGVIIPQTLDAQALVGRRGWFYSRRIPWAVYDPYHAMTSRVYAQADLIRAQGDAAADFAVARKLHAQARAQELENWEETVRKQWDVRILREKKKLELNHAHQISKMRYLNDQKWKNNRTWERLKNHPELSSFKIENGSAHNFLLSRLAVSALPYQFDETESRYGPEALRELRLDDELLEQVTLIQGDFRFAANQSVQEQIDQWPYFLRWKEFDSERNAFEQARGKVVTESNASGEVSIDTIHGLQEAQLKLSKAFHFSSRVWDWVKENRRYTQYNDSVRFLAQLDREIGQLERTGDIRPFQGKTGYDPGVHGEHVISLLSFMNRNGLTFAPAKPGSEPAYHRLFVMMRAVYLTVADADESIQPKKLSEEIILN